MSMYKCICDSCNHLFYDIITPCVKSNNLICPICNSKDIKKNILKKPKDTKWAEDIGCKHKNGCQKNCQKF